MSEEKKAVEPQIRDFDKISPEKRIARIGGKEFDVTRIPSRVALEMARFSDKSGDRTSEESFMEMVGLVVRVCKKSDPSITVEWLIDNTDFMALQAFIEYALTSLKERAAGNADPARPS